MSTLFKLVILIALTTQTKCNKWGYVTDAEKPDKWPSLFKEMCAGLAQSPIDIKDNETAFIGDIKPTVAIASTAVTADKITIKNNGHTIEMTPVDKKWTVTFSTSKPVEYTVAGVHFHWGSADTKGSEHKIDGKAFPLEMHIVSYNSKIYTDFAAAKGKPNGLAVIAVLFNLEAASNTKVGLDNFGTFLTELSKCVLPNSAGGETVPFDPKVLLPKENTKFYRYFGSLTTPPCTENVQWTVMQGTIPVTVEQLVELRKLKYDATNQMQDNFRPPLPLNPDGVLQQRTVFRSWKTDDDDGGDKGNSAFNFLPCSSLLLLILTFSLSLH